MVNGSDSLQRMAQSLLAEAMADLQGEGDEEEAMDENDKLSSQDHDITSTAASSQHLIDNDDSLLSSLQGVVTPTDGGAIQDHIECSGVLKKRRKKMRRQKHKKRLRKNRYKNRK